MDEPKQQAAAWFRQLRDRICAEFEQIEKEYGESRGKQAAPALSGASRDLQEANHGGNIKFTRKAWDRAQGGGGEISIIKGRVFEKAGVNISTVHGEFSEQFRKEIPGAADHPQFWASGISVVAHPCSPLVPSVHMNTRMIVLGDAKLWFGGGADLTPTFPVAEDVADFHAALRKTCERFSPDYYPKFKTWCDEYFFIRHRNEPRGAGGIFYDYLNSGSEQDFVFTQAVGETFLQIYPMLVRRRMQKEWTKAQKHTQLVKRGRYAEFNLIYDRGTRFGLMTDGNPEAILMSLPPEAAWD